LKGVIFDAKGFYTSLTQILREDDCEPHQHRSARSDGRRRWIRSHEVCSIDAHQVHYGGSSRDFGINTEMGQKMPQEAQKLLVDTVELPGDTIAFLSKKRE
jgi:hypothetical protein